MSRDQELERQIARMDAEAKIADAAERLRFQQQCALAAVRALTLVNGGAILALLTFIGNNDARYDTTALKAAITGYVVGLAFALSTYVLAYHSEAWNRDCDTSDAWNYQDDMRQLPRRHEAVASKERHRGWLLQISAISLVTASLLMFAYASFQALNGIIG